MPLIALLRAFLMPCAALAVENLALLQHVAVLKRLRLRQLVSAYHAPGQNACAKRVIGTLRRECLDHLIVMGERHAHAIPEERVKYHNAGRAP